MRLFRSGVRHFFFATDGLFGGLQRASAGKVIVDGTDISRIPESELTRLRAGWDGPALFARPPPHTA